ncbi:hypothetical protein, partial [Shewanella chilikensis]
KAVLNRHKKSETYKQVSDCLSSEGSVNRSLSDLHCRHGGDFFALLITLLSKSGHTRASDWGDINDENYHGELLRAGAVDRLEFSGNRR